MCAEGRNIQCTNMMIRKGGEYLALEWSIGIKTYLAWNIRGVQLIFGKHSSFGCPRLILAYTLVANIQNTPHYTRLCSVGCILGGQLEKHLRAFLWKLSSTPRNGSNAYTDLSDPTQLCWKGGGRGRGSVRPYTALTDPMNCVTRRFLILPPYIPPFGRITSDMSVTQFLDRYT